MDESLQEIVDTLSLRLGRPVLVDDLDLRPLAHSTQWGELDYLLIDLPPGTGDVQMGLARLLPRTEMLVVTTPPLPFRV